MREPSLLSALLAQPLVWVGLALSLSAILTWLAIHYAHGRQMLDLPGQRRSHSVPTARGGGVGFVVALLAVGVLAASLGAPLAWPLQTGVPLLGAILLVAAAGWMDDHRDVPARLRILAHAAAAIAVLAAALPVIQPGFSLEAILLSLVLGLGIVWSINLHNFMDGINGLLAVQAIFAFLVLAGLIHHAGGAPLVVVWLCVFAAVTIGFLPFNFPRARVFMGDVGSGTLGLLVALAVLWQSSTPATALGSGLLVCSAFVTDATCTLVSRMLRGRRWYSAHREHLYQWLVRCGHSHARVVLFYSSWNLLIVLPAVCWMNRMGDEPSPTAQALAVTVAVYALAVGVWCLGKRACLRSLDSRRTHATA